MEERESQLCCCSNRRTNYYISNAAKKKMNQKGTATTWVRKGECQRRPRQLPVKTTKNPQKKQPNKTHIHTHTQSLHFSCAHIRAHLQVSHLGYQRYCSDHLQRFSFVRKCTCTICTLNPALWKSTYKYACMPGYTHTMDTHTHERTGTTRNSQPKQVEKKTLLQTNEFPRRDLASLHMLLLTNKENSNANAHDRIDTFQNALGRIHFYLFDVAVNVPKKTRCECIGVRNTSQRPLSPTAQYSGMANDRFHAKHHTQKILCTLATKLATD